MPDKAQLATMDIPSLLGLGAGAFVASNVDDLFILIAFFSNRSFPTFQIVIGQYVGMGSLLAVSLLGLLVALVVPSNIIGLIGLVPIAIGIKEILERRRKRAKGTEESPSAKMAYLPFLAVAAVTFSGGEEIGIYAPLFATNTAIVEIITLVSITMALTGLWCWIAHYLVNRSYLAERFRRVGEIALPFILIGIGLYILAEAFLIA